MVFFLHDVPSDVAFVRIRYYDAVGKKNVISYTEIFNEKICFVIFSPSQFNFSS